jgi:hypothetical protein
MIAEIIKQIVKTNAEGRITVPSNSRKITNCILKQNVPHRVGRKTSSNKF